MLPLQAVWVWSGWRIKILKATESKKEKEKDINLLSKAVNNIFSAPALETNFQLHYLNTNIFKRKIINVSPMKFFL